MLLYNFDCIFKWLHDRGFVHRDVRHIVQCASETGWARYAHRFGTIAGMEGHVEFRSDWWPELQDSQYIKEIDLMMLGNMVSIYAYLDTDEVGWFCGQGFNEMLSIKRLHS